MKYEVVLKPSSMKDLDQLRKYDAVNVLDSIERHLTSEHNKESKSRIRRLRRKQPADYRLRAGDFRIFYAVEGTTVFYTESHAQTRNGILIIRRDEL